MGFQNTITQYENMAIPKDILAVQRPSSTVVKRRGARFVVIKRTSKRVGGKIKTR